MKPIKAWAALSTDERVVSLVPWGNGSPYQFPVFPTRKDARGWRDEDTYRKFTVRLVRVEICEVQPRLKPKVTP